jgi:O-antigen/teichoic acid export membrane protein
MIKSKFISILRSTSIKNSFYTLSEASSSLLFIIVSLPIFLTILGPEKYGIYLLIQSFSSFVKMFNLGGNFTVTKFISQYRGDNCIKKIGEFSSTIFVFQLVLSLIVLFIFYFLLDYLIVNFFDQTSNFQIFESIIFFAIPIFLIDLFEQNFNGLHKGYERFDRALKISLFSKLVKYSVQIGVILATKSLVDVYIVTFFSSLAVFILHCFLCKKWYKEISFFTSVKWKMLKEFFNFSLWVWLMSIVSLMTSQLDKWLVLGLYDLKVLAYYGIGVSIFNQLHVLTSSSVSWIFPKISFNGISQSTRSSFSNSSLTLPIISTTITLFILLISDFIFGHWLGEEKYSSAEKYIKLFICILPVMSTTIVPYYFLLGLGKIRTLFFLGLITSIILISSLFILSNYYDLTVVILSFLISYLSISFFYQYEVIKSLQVLKPWKNYLAVALSGIISIILFVNILE